MKKKSVLSIILVFTLLQSCIVTRTLQLVNCDFNFNQIKSFTANGVDVLNQSSLNDLSFNNKMNLSKSLLTGKMAVDVEMALDVVNKSDGKAVMNTVDWILLLKKEEVLSGTTNTRMLVEAGEMGVLLLKFSFNLFKVLKGSNISDLWEIANNPSNPDLFTIKIKPSVQIAGQQVKYPGYININY